MTSTPSRLLGALAAVASFAVAVPSDARADGLAVHGSVSATAGYSDRYNYLGDTNDSLDLGIIEVILNGSHRFENGLRLSAQLYAYQIDDYNDLALDFAVLDYSFNEKFGVRAGRFKRPAGLYGDAQDIDIVRPFAFLPLEFYPKTLRPLVAGMDGVAIYGTLPMGAAGSLEYLAGYGWLPKLDVKSPYLMQVGEGGLSTAEEFESGASWTLSLAWNTPVEGLKFVVTANDSQDLEISGPMKTSAQLASAPSDARATPMAFPPGVYDLVVAGQPASLTGSALRWTVSAEYTKGDWQFAAEYLLNDNDFTARYPAPLGTVPSHTKGDVWYASATWQVQPKLQLGTYYSAGYANKDDRDGSANLIVPDHLAYLKDTAFAASYSLASWWLLKGEVHFANGTRGLSAAANGDAVTWRKDWTYYVIKSTVSF